MAEARVMKKGTRPPWVGLAAAVWVQIAAGSAFAFPLYSHSLKKTMEISQKNLALLGVANDFGENFGLPVGLFSNRVRPWVLLLVGAGEAFLGFGFLWYVLAHDIHNVAFGLLGFALILGTNSSACLGTAAILTNMRNFPHSRGEVSGILKGYVALSAAVYTQVHSGVLHNSPTKLLLILAFGIPVICLVVMYCVRACVPSVEDDSLEPGRFKFVQHSSMALGLYLVVVTILSDHFAVPDWLSYAFLVVTVMVLLSPFGIPVWMTMVRPKDKRSDSVTTTLNSSSDHENSNSQSSNESSPEGEDVDTLLAQYTTSKPRRGENFTFCQAVIKADFWLLFLAYFIGVGSGVTVLNNLAQIGLAADIEDATILLCLFSFFNFVGRLGGGSISEYLVRSKHLPRTALMVCTQLLMCVIYLFFISGTWWVIYVLTALLGACYGAQFTVMIPTASEIFGLRDFGTIYNFMLLGNPLGALFFSYWLAGSVYDSEFAKQPSNNHCLGPDCFRLTFLVLTFVCLVGCVIAFCLTMRLMRVYENLYHREALIQSH